MYLVDAEREEIGQSNIESSSSSLHSFHPQSFVSISDTASPSITRSVDPVLTNSSDFSTSLPLTLENNFNSALQCPPANRSQIDIPSTSIRSSFLPELDISSVFETPLSSESTANKHNQPHPSRLLLPVLQEESNIKSPRSSTPSKLTQSEEKRPPAKRYKQSTVDKHQVLTSPEMQHELDLQVTRLIASTLSSFTLVENEHFKRLWTMLRPGSRAPERHAVADELLDEIFEQEVKKVADITNGERATVSLDGWSNITNNPVIGVAATVSNAVMARSIFSHAIDTAGTFITKKLYKIINLYFFV